MNEFQRTFHHAVQRMVLNRLEYDKQRYQILNEYMDARRRAIRLAALRTKRSLKHAHTLAEARGDLMLELVHRDINAELDTIIEYSDLMAINADDDLYRDFPIKASASSKKKKAFAKTADFLSMFEEFLR